MIYYSAGQASYYNGGGYYIKGGSQKLSDYLSEYIKKQGGELLLNHLVKKIIVKNNIAVGIECHQKSSSNNVFQSFYGNAVVVNSSIPSVVDMLPPDSAAFIKNRLSKMEVACSLLSIYIGFKSELKLDDHKHYSTFVSDANVKTLHDVKLNYNGPHESRNFVFVDFNQIHADLAPVCKSAGVICVVDYLHEWEGLDREKYAQKKKEVAEIYLSRLEKLIPGIKKEVEFYEVATPKTIERYTLNTGGSVYGFAQTPKQTGLYRFQSKSHIKNMYYASAWANPGGGFTGAILSGWFCAREILKK
jgi:phytoene dehydrogenase-like protein